MICDNVGVVTSVSMAVAILVVACFHLAGDPPVAASPALDLAVDDLDLADAIVDTIDADDLAAAGYHWEFSGPEAFPGLSLP